MTKRTPRWYELDEFTTQYLETALWSSTDESDESGGVPLDENYGVEDFTKKAIREAVADCEAFQKEHGDLYDDDGTAGHDFWLTRNGHGAGFWDGDYPEPQAGQLTAASKAYGSVDLYVYRGKVRSS